MHIVLVIHHPLDPDSGAAGSIWQLGHAYRELGHDVDYLSHDDLPQRLSEKAKMVLFPTFVARRLQRMASRRGVGVIDATAGDAWMWASLFRRHSLRSPLLVARSHGLEHTAQQALLHEVRAGNVSLSWKYPLYHGGFRLWEVAFSFRQADLALFRNRHDLEYAVARLGVDREKARHVPQGIPSSFLARPVESMNAHGSGIRIAQVGSYIPRKGVHYGAIALNAVLRRHPDVGVSFLGTGHPEDRVLDDFDPAVREQIEVLPRFKHDELPTLLRGHQIKLLPSTSEGFGKALVEAMACGLAPVATATEGPREIVRHGENGLLVPPRDSQAIAGALEQLIQDAALLERLRRSAYESAQQYSWPRIAHRILSLYDEADSRRSGRPAVTHANRDGVA